MTTRRFECTTDGANKFWEVEVTASELRVRFGKLGTDGQQSLKSFPDEAKATAAAEKLIREKVGKGYVERGASKPGKRAAVSAPTTSAGADRLIATLTKHYPRYVAAQKAPGPLKPLGAFGALPAALTTLWKWRDGADALFVQSEPEGMDWLDVSSAAGSTTMLRSSVPTFPKTLLACATDGAGNFLCVDLESQAVVDWDHETRKTKVVAKSIDEFLTRIAKRVDAGKFRDGHEAPAGKVDRRVSQAMTLLEQSASDHQVKIIELVSNAGPEGAVQALRALRQALPKKSVSPELLDELARHQTLAGDFRGAIATSAELGAAGGVPAMTAQGRLEFAVTRALEGKHHDVALEALQVMSQLEPSADALVGQVVASSLLGKPTAPLAAKAEQAIAKALKTKARPVPNPRVRAQYALDDACHRTALAAIHRALLRAVEKRVDEARKLLAEGHATVNQLVATAPADVQAGTARNIGSRAHAVINFEDGVLLSLATAVRLPRVTG